MGNRPHQQNPRPPTTAHRAEPDMAVRTESGNRESLLELPKEVQGIAAEEQASLTEADSKYRFIGVEFGLAALD